LTARLLAVPVRRELEIDVVTDIHQAARLAHRSPSWMRKHEPG
jgi:hypothetical protein